MNGYRKWIVLLAMPGLLAAVALFRQSSRTPATAGVAVLRHPQAAPFDGPVPERAATGSLFAVFDRMNPEAADPLQVRYALPVSEPVSIRIGAGDEPAFREGSDVIAADLAVLSRRKPRTDTTGIFRLPPPPGGQADSEEVFSWLDRWLDLGGSKTEGFALFRPDATFDVHRVMPVVVSASGGFSMGLKYRWAF